MNIKNYIKDIKINLIKKENFYYLFLIFIIFLLDRYSKIYVINNLIQNDIYFNDYLNFKLIWNTGIGFGLFSTNSTLVYNFFTLLISVVILVLLYISLYLKKLDRLIYCIIVGGALGNFYDRLTFQAVPDFIDFHYENYHWFTFNIADIFISIGIIAFITRSFFIKN